MFSLVKGTVFPRCLDTDDRVTFDNQSVVNTAYPFGKGADVSFGHFIIRRVIRQRRYLPRYKPIAASWVSKSPGNSTDGFDTSRAA